MKQSFPIRKILWAHDPYAEDNILQTRILETLRVLSQGNGIMVESVSLVSPNDHLAKDPVAAGIWVRSCEATLAKFRGESAWATPKLLVQGDLFLASAVKRILEYGEQNKVDLIVTGSRARQGVSRFLLGSFSEALVLQSRVPVMVVSPRSQPIDHLENIVYPTDLTEKSHDCFPLVVELARALGASITLLHRAAYEPLSPTTLQPRSPSIRSELAVDISRQEGMLQDLRQIAQHHQVPVTLEVQSGDQNLVSSLKKYGTDPRTIVGMVSQTKTDESLILGSFTRQVLAHAECPLWIFHPKPSSKPRT